jgi:hypothetical protein
MSVTGRETVDKSPRKLINIFMQENWAPSPAAIHVVYDRSWSMIAADRIAGG